MSGNDEVYDRIVKVITETLRVPPENITAESRLAEDLGADSLDRLTLLMQLEDEFNRKISDEDAQGLTTVGATLEYIKRNAA